MTKPKYYSIDGRRVIGQGKDQKGREFFMVRKWGKIYKTFDLGDTWKERKAKVKV